MLLSEKKKNKKKNAIFWKKKVSTAAFMTDALRVE